MGNNASVKSAMEGRELAIPINRPIPEASNANGWENVTGEFTHFGWDSSSGSTGISDQGWIDESREAQYNGWGESATESKNNSKRCSSGECVPPEVSSSGWMDEPAKEEYKGWLDEPAKKEFNGWIDEPVEDEYNGWGVPQSALANNPSEDTQIADGIQPQIHSSNGNHTLVPLAPSAPPLPDDILCEGTSHYPSRDSTSMDLMVPSKTREAPTTNDTRDENSSSLCIICWESPVEGACVPCGHVAGCMPCLNEIRLQKGDCPICRAKIDQVIRLYAV